MAEKPTWNFKKLTVEKGKIKLVELDGKQKAIKSRYQHWLEWAIESQAANPIYSNYHVKEAVGFADGITSKAGNIEYGFCKALHGEEFAVAAFRSLHDRDNQVRHLILAILGAEGNVPTPCGNCRDLMLDEWGSNFEIVSGAPTGGLAVVSKFADYIFNGEDYARVPRYNYLTLSENGFMSRVWDTKRMGERIEMAYVTNDIHSERSYFASILTGKNTHSGALDLMSEYHPIYPLEDAVRQARRNKDPYVKQVVILRKDIAFGPPHVMYRDRQHLYELNLQQELLLGKEVDPKVFLVSQKGQGQIGGVWETSVKEWLPHPFSPRNFGDEYIKGLTEYYQSKLSS